MSYTAVKIEPLGKENFDTWKIQIQALLTKNDAWKYVNGSCPKPDSPPVKVAEWESEDAKAKSDLILAIAATELKQIRDCTTSKDVWSKLHNVYQSKGPARKAMLLKSLILLKMKNGQDMRDHVKHFFDVVDKIQEMELEIIDDLLTVLLLYSIPEEYESFRIAIETQEKLPQPEALKVKLLEEYEARKRNHTESTSDAMFVHKNTHNRSRNFGKEKFKFACHSCGKIGHKAKDCRVKTVQAKSRENEVKRNENTRTAEVAMQVNAERERWCLDSGASSHMCGEKEKFKELKPSHVTVLHLANNESTKIHGNGIVKVVTNEGITAKFEDTLYVPDLRSNLLSVAKITDHGFNVVFTATEATVVRLETDEMVMVAKRFQDLYYVSEQAEKCRVAQINVQEWHDRFGHLNEKDLRKALREGKVIGAKVSLNEEMPICEVCVKGKQTQKPFPISETKSTMLLELIHTDVCGPMRTNSLGGSRYFVTFIDDKSRWCEIYFIKNKSEVITKFKEYKQKVEKRTGKSIKCIRSDNGTEYVNNEMQILLKKEGIKHERTIEYTPQQNGIAERKNRTLVEMARCMMIQSELPPVFWAEAVLTANYIRNRCPSRSLEGETPFKLWTGRSPNVSHFRKFGSTAYALDKTRTKGKFEPKSRKCIFIGYSEESKAYRLWDADARKVLRSRDVIFSNTFESKAYEEFIDEDNCGSSLDVGMSFDLVNTEKDKMRSITENSSEESNEDCDSENESSEHYTTPMTSLRGPGRPKKLLTGKRGRPRKLFNTVRSVNEEVPSEPVEKYHNIAGLVVQDDQSTDEALSSQEAVDWRNAMKTEYDALMKNHTWDIVERPGDKKIVECKWVLRTKHKPDGTLERRKARLVAKGFTQIPGIDFDETYAPVARIGSIRLLVALAAEYDLTLHQLDFVTAYLNGDIEEEIYMRIPKEFDQILNKDELKIYEGDKVCLIKKALYGLKQSGRQWYKKLDEKLKLMKFQPLKSDPCVFIKKRGRDMVIITVYVDDLIVASNNHQMLNELKMELAKSFEMKDLGELNFCLGISFKQDSQNHTVTMSQEKYVKDILMRFDMQDAKTVTTPMNQNIKLSKEMSPKTEKEKKEVEHLPYQNLIGSLMYLAVSTRPDIAHAVSVLSQYNTNYGQQHWIAAKRVLRYLKGTANMGLLFKRTRKPLVGYADADWGANIDDRRSYTGFVFKLANAAVSWESRKQKTVAMSSTEAEYMALTESAKEAIHLKRLLAEIQGQLSCTTIFNDNQGAGLLSKNPIFHNRTKHVDIRHHFVRETVERGEISIEYLSTERMPADVLTKALSSPKHNKCIQEIGLTII